MPSSLGKSRYINAFAVKKRFKEDEVRIGSEEGKSLLDALDSLIEAHIVRLVCVLIREKRKTVTLQSVSLAVGDGKEITKIATGGKQ